MDSKSSNLSSLGCDFVVATTQASINSGMLEYLAEATQPIEYICFLRDKSGIPSEQISLEKLKELTGGIDPFYIPDGTSYDDPRLKALSKAGFKVGIKMQMGLPPGVTPRDLTIVNFEDGNAKTALFNLYCSQLTVIDNTPPDYYGDGGYWGVWSQPSGQPWTAQIRVDLLAKDLDDELNTPYLNNHPKVKQQIKKNLQNLSGTAFSLQQLMYNLDSASLQTLPTFPTLDPKSDAAYVLGEYFVNRYQTSAKEHGLPLLSVSAVAQPRDESELQITAMERFIMLLKDGNGMPIEHGDKAQQSATTLNYLCAVNNHQLPYITNLNWNWVRPDEVNERSGMMAINRNVLLQSISDKVKEAAPASCYKIQFALGDDNITMSPGGTPTITIASSGSNVIHVEYSDNCDDISVDTGEWFCNMRLQTKYTCDITFSGQSINVNQEIEKNLDCISAFVMDPDGNAPGPEIIVEPDKYEWRYIDTSASSQAYDLSVNQNGALQLTKGANSASSTSKFSDNYINPDFDTASVTPFVQEWLKRVPEWKSVEIHGLEISQLHTFIFPGGKTFTYKKSFLLR
ncbi:hypothetical protein TrVGV298_007954 [Trichoderma virens]|nr:hypothetical protein TrVGV298_007954 [Trichoderma virens]